MTKTSFSIKPIINNPTRMGQTAILEKKEWNQNKLNSSYELNEIQLPVMQKKRYQFMV